MRALLQRVKWACVKISGETVARIEGGLLILFAVGQGDEESQTGALAKKIAELRIFPDADGKMNLSLKDCGGSALIVSQFTLYADCTRGRRPFFGTAEEPVRAAAMCDRFIEEIRALGLHAQSGRFGADMQVELCNDGPVTIWLDAD